MKTDRTDATDVKDQTEAQEAVEAATVRPEPVDAKGLSEALAHPECLGSRLARISPEDRCRAAEFSERMRDMTRAEKGSWGERAVVAEARADGHTIISGHPDTPTRSGFDCVSFDERRDHLHIWEAKNFEGGTVTEDTMKAWRTRRTRPNWEEVLQSVRGTDLEPRIKQAVNEGRVTFHVRIGPDTKISHDYLTELQTASFPGGRYDFRQYTAEEMLRHRQREYEDSHDHALG